MNWGQGQGLFFIFSEYTYCSSINSVGNKVDGLNEQKMERWMEAKRWSSFSDFFLLAGNG